MSAGSSNAVASFVTALYRDLLSRTPSQGEINGWLGTAQVSRATVATGFVHSIEYRSDVVGSYYFNLLHRPSGAGPPRLANWANSSVDLYSIMLAFEGAPEYLMNA